MPTARWMTPVVGVALVAALASPAVARARAAASNRALLDAGTVTSGDVPPSWTASKQHDTSDKSFASIAACKQIRAASSAARKSVPRRLSPTFTDLRSPNQLTSAEDTVYAFKDAAAAERFLSVYKATDAQACLTTATKKAVGRAVVQVSAAPVASLHGVGDDSAGWEATLHATDRQGNSVTVVFDVIAVRVGRAFVGFDFSNQGGPLGQARSIITAVVQRVAAA
jgi:hypothetical protein